MKTISDEFLDLQAALAGEYSIERELGRGGMGIVYLARDVQLDREVAIKVLPSHLARQLDARDRFLREARTAAGLSHPHIVPIHRVGEAGGFVFLVMSYVAGETLGERLRAQGPLAPADVTRIMREVAWALAYAHGRGIVHRDVKPDNILLEAGTGRAVVTDFGIAHGGGAPGPVTDPGRIMGTAHFMSPEQAASETLDGRSDIYSLGVVGYLALSGRLPFEASSLPGLLVRQASEPAPTVALVAPGLPSTLARTIDRCLERDVALRFTDGEALAEALVPAVDTRPRLPTTLRAWLSARNPAIGAYGAWSAMFGVAAVANSVELITRSHYSRIGGVLELVALAAAPLLPIVGFHLNQAWRLFRAGHTLADLRLALDVEVREQAEGDALVVEPRVRRQHTVMRMLTYASAATSGIVISLAIKGMLHPTRMNGLVIIAPIVCTLVFAAVSNALNTPLMPAFVRERMQEGIRERLWRSRVGEWLAGRLGAPARSRMTNSAAFRATEAVLSVAAGDLYAALPVAYREQLAELPATVAALEARAAEARSDIESLGALASADREAGDLLATRRAAATAQLSSTVAALEGIRLDLLRLHAGAGDLAPLTTLIDAARQVGAEMGRMADARRETEHLLVPRGVPARIPTPV